MSHRSTMISGKDVLVDKIKEDSKLAANARRAAVVKTEYQDEEDEISDEKQAVALSKNFEFTDNLSVMKVIRMCIFFQVIAVILDSPRLHVPPIFNMVCGPGFYYSIRFYSQPFMDFVYIVQKFLNAFIVFAQAYLPGSPEGTRTVDTSGTPRPPGYSRRLAESGERAGGPLYSSAYFEIDFLEDQNWQSYHYMGHFFLGGFFAVFALLFLFRMWQIPDYTNRKAVRRWMKDYVADGWWKRGGLRVATSILKGLAAGVLVLGLIQLVSTQGNVSTHIDARIVGGIIAICASVTVVLWAAGIYFIKLSESAFARYVSQNVNYTSIIILKRVIKVKVELGLAAVFLLFIPVIYSWAQAVTIIHDWNDTLIVSRRKHLNFYTPCYIGAFPPFHEDVGPYSADTCPDLTFMSPLQVPREDGFFKDTNLIPCDSLLGNTLYVMGAVGLTLFVVTYVWLIHHHIDLAVVDLTRSRWMEPIYNLEDKCFAERKYYVRDFPWIRRTPLALYFEMRQQFWYLEDALRWVMESVFFVLHSAVSIALLPLMVLYLPGKYYGKRLLICCSCTTRGAKVDAETGEQAQVDVNDPRIKKDEIARTALSYKSVKMLQEGEEGVTFLQASVTVLYRFFVRQYRRFFRFYNDTSLGRIQNEVSFFFRTVYRRTLKVLSLSKDTYTVGGVDTLDGIAAHPWRDDLTLRSRERVVRRMFYRLANEFRTVKTEFVTDHMLTITVFDQVIDSAGVFLVIAPYKMTRLRWPKVYPLEMLLYPIVAVYMNYYHSWQERAVVLCCFNAAMVVLTYWANPFSEHGDKWADWTGRWMIIVIVAGLVVSAPVTEIHRYGDTAGLADVKEYYRSLHRDPWSAGAYLLVDILMTSYVLIYLLSILKAIGVFEMVSRYFHGLRYAMHDKVVNFLMEKAEERNLGGENMNTGLALIEQWDDVIRSQRRYALLLWPDVRPAPLMTCTEKLTVMKWSALFNLTLTNIRTSLGLSILHTAICSGDVATVRYLVHSHPELLVEEDSQRDTPVSIGLKEAAFFLIMYASRNQGMLDDGTSFSDDDFYEYYPEAGEMRDMVVEYGEIMPEVTEVYVLSAADIESVKMSYHFLEKKPTFVDPNLNHAIMFTNQVTNNEIYGEEVTPPKRAARFDPNSLSPAKQGPPAANSPQFKKLSKHEQRTQRMRQELLGRNPNYIQRFPEDLLHDEFEAGQAVSWTVIGISVPEHTIDNDFYGEDEDFAVDARDMKYAIDKDKDMNYTAWDTAVPAQHEALLSNKWGSELAEDRPKSKGRQRLENVDTGVFENPIAYPVSSKLYEGRIEEQDPARGDGGMMVRQYFDSNVTTAEIDRTIRSKLCNFTDLFTSKEVAERCQQMEWDVAAYKELNKMSSRLQGIVAQNLAECFNLNPPKGFSALSEWSSGKTEDLEVEQEHEGHQRQRGNRSQLDKGVFTGAIAKLGQLISRLRRGYIPPEAFNDRIVMYLAEAYVSSRTTIDLSSQGMSTHARVAWRAMCRVLRRKYSSFVVPSLFTDAKQVVLLKLIVKNNQLDDGDAVMLGDIICSQQTLVYCDASENRIGTRGMIRLCACLKDHASMKTFRIDKNRIGPGCGRDIAIWLKKSTTIKTLSMSHNRMGDLIRYTNEFTRERIPSAAKDIFLGVKKNKSLESLDLSYNHFGPLLGECVPPAVVRHPCLSILNIAGNALGPLKGPNMLWTLAGRASGAKEFEKAGGIQAIVDGTAKAVEDANKQRKKAAGKVHEDDEPDDSGAPMRALMLPDKKKKKTGSLTNRSRASRATSGYGDDESDFGGDGVRKKVSRLVDLNIADNQLGTIAGIALGTYVKKCRSLTSLDVSGNSLGLVGGRYVIDAIGEMYGVDEAKKKKRREEDAKIISGEISVAQSKKGPFKPLTVADAKAVDIPKKAVHLLNLNVSRNGLGPEAVVSLMECLLMPVCSLTDLDISGNPLGEVSAQSHGSNGAIVASQMMRLGLTATTMLKRLNISDLSLVPTHTVAILGGLASNIGISKFKLNNVVFDEPSCLQLATALESCDTILNLEVRHALMGSKGGSLVCSHIEKISHRLTRVDLTGNCIGYFAMQPIASALAAEGCAFKSLLLADNEISEFGGLLIAKSLEANGTLTELDLSNNQLGEEFADKMNLVTRTIIINGVNVTKCNLKKVILNDNPMIRGKGAKMLINAFATEKIHHFEIANIGAGPRAAFLLAKLLRRVTVAWEFVNLSRNKFSRSGLNQIFWALRQNRRLLTCNLGGNEGGPNMGTDEDVLGVHGIALPRSLRENLTLTDLDLSYNGISSAAAINIFGALEDNYSITKFSLRGNILDDQSANALNDLLRANDVIEEIDLGDNKLGYNCCFALADGLDGNRALQILHLDRNQIGSAGVVVIEQFWRMLIKNTTLRFLDLDDNRLGPEWGVKIASALVRNNTLIQLSLRNNRLDAHAGEALLMAYKHHKYLLELAVSSEEIGLECYERFKNLYDSKRAVRAQIDVDHETNVNDVM